MKAPQLISADAHVVEPPDLWLQGLPERFRNRAPRQLQFAEGDAWQVEGVAKTLQDNGYDDLVVVENQTLSTPFWFRYRVHRLVALRLGPRSTRFF